MEGYGNGGERREGSLVKDKAVGGSARTWREKKHQRMQHEGASFIANLRCTSDYNCGPFPRPPLSRTRMRGVSSSIPAARAVPGRFASTLI